MAEVATRVDTSKVSSEEQDIRVEDYLNDKLQTNADLENLDSLLATVRNQQALLKKQVMSLAARLLLQLYRSFCNSFKRPR